MDELEGLGQKIKYYRKIHELTQEGLAVILGVEPDHVANIERGRSGISLQKLILVCKHFHIGLSDILPIEQQDDTELRRKWIDDINNAVDRLDTTQLGIIKTMIKSLLIDK